MPEIFAPGQRVQIRLQVNGQPRLVRVEPAQMLAQVIRDDLGLTGTKVSCGMANCGACTILRNGVPIYSCITLAIDCDGSELTTIEGLASGTGLHPVQRAFIEQDAYQCGFCTSGQILSLAAFLEGHPSPSEAEIRLAMAGNLCRCGAYLKIVKAGLIASELMADDHRRRGPRPSEDRNLT
jgi:aerobic-type carbon monoxide dehydrogenase small subunit (CoxS/CutS family)